MPGILRVRFAYKSTFHSPPMPLLTSDSGSSIPQSPRPISPPSVYPVVCGPSPCATPRIPRKRARVPVFTGRVHPRRCLEILGLTYNLMDPPSHITHNHRSISSRRLREPATNPSLPFLTITCPYLHWAITVYASNGSFVTLGDVFDHLYRSLRTNLTQEDFASLPNQGEQLKATRAYEQRYRRLRSSREYDAEKRSGMKRVDLLMGHTRFLGISNGGRRPDDWLLNVI